MNRLEGQSLLIVVPEPKNRSSVRVSLGDLVRILMILPAFDARRTVWASNQDLFPLANLSEAVEATIEIDQAALVAEEYDWILNLSLAQLDWNHKNIFNLCDEFPDNGYLKEKTYNLMKIFYDFFGYIRYKIYLSWCNKKSGHLVSPILL